MSNVILPPPMLVPPVLKERTNILWWFLNLLIPGVVLAFRGKKVRTKILGWSFLIIFFSTVATILYVYLTYGLKEAGIWLASDSYRLTIAFCGIAGVIGIFAISHMLTTTYLVRTGGWKLPTKIVLSTVSTLIVGSMLAGVAFVGMTVDNLNTTLMKFADEAVTFEQPKYEQGNKSKPSAPVEGPVWGDVKRINIMVLGSDAGYDRSGIRPDILMVASINTETGNTNLFNVPRNLIGAHFPAGSPAAEEFPNGFTSHDGMLNAVWAWGSNRPDLFPGSTNPGLTATRDVLTEMFGLDIQHYLVLNLQGFEDFVNLMGGVVLNIPRDIPYNDGQLAIAAGDGQLLNGEKALWFARERYTNTDYDRMERQRCVVGALVQQITPTKLVTKSNELMAVLQANMFTNIAQEDLKDWVTLFEKVQKATLSGFAFIPPMITPHDPDLGFIRAKVQEIVAADDTISMPTPTPKEVAVSPEGDPVPQETENTSVTPPAVDTGYQNPYCGT